tara:strand:- start:112 stop:1014 length:903 start_codon:yes stop_codon:yes gene_type:complete
MASAQTIINKSLRLLGVLASGEAPTAAEAFDALDSLNSLVDMYSANSAYYYTNLDETFTLVAAQGNYCIGNSAVPIVSLIGVTTTATATTSYPHSFQSGNKATISGAVESPFNITAVVTVVSPTVFTYPIASTTATATGTPVCTAGDFYTVRPIRLLAAFTRLTTVDSPLALITEQFWNNIADKALAAAIPIKLLYRPNYPFGQIILYGVPTGTPVLHLKSEKTISQYTTLVSDQLIPPGYRRLLELSLAIDLAAEYGSRVPEQTLAYLKADLASLIQTNMQLLQTSKLQAQPANQGLVA